MAITFIGTGTPDLDINTASPPAGGTIGTFGPLFPAGYAKDDLLIAYVQDDDKGTTQPVITPAGWTLLLTGIPGVAAVGARYGTLRIYYKIAASASETVFKAGMAGAAYPDGTGRGSCNVVAFRGVSLTTPFAQTPAFSTTTATTALATASSMTTTGSEWVLFWRSSSSSASGMTQTSTTGWTNAIADQSTTAASLGWSTVGMWYSGDIAPGSYAADSTIATGTATYGSVWGQIALNASVANSEIVNYAQQVRASRW